MDDNFKLEIISPEKIIFSDDVVSVTIPAYEGDMSILKNHISIITFLRPGIIKIEKKDKNLSNFFVQDGTVEFFNDVLAILSTSVVNVENLEKDSLDKLIKNVEEIYHLGNIIIFQIHVRNSGTHCMLIGQDH